MSLSAPGNDILSSIPVSRKGEMTGTSQATAFVSGVAAMLKSQNPELSPHQLKKIIAKTVSKSILLLKKCSSSGMLNASRSLEHVLKISTK